MLFSIDILVKNHYITYIRATKSSENPASRIAEKPNRQQTFAEQDPKGELICYRELLKCLTLLNVTDERQYRETLTKRYIMYIHTVDLKGHISREDFQSYLNTLNGLDRYKTEKIMKTVRHEFTTYEDCYKDLHMDEYPGVCKGYIELMKSFELPVNVVKDLKVFCKLKEISY